MVHIVYYYFMTNWITNRIKSNITIVKNAGYLSVIEVIRLAMPFIAIPYIISTVGSSNYGLAVFSQTIISYFTIFINWGLDVSAVKDVSVNRNDKNALNSIVSCVLGIKLILFFISFIILLLCIWLVPFMREHYLLFLFAFITCISEVLFPVWFYQGIEKMKYLTLVRASSILFYACSIFIFINDSEDYPKVVLLQSLGNVIASCFSAYLLFVVHKIKIIKPGYQLLFTTFKDSFPFFMSRLSVIFNNTMAKTLSGIFFTMEAVAAFDIAQKVATASLIPAQMLNVSVYPHIAKTKSKEFVRKYLKVNVLVSFATASVIAILSSYIISVLSKNELTESVNLLRILCFWIFFGGITGYIGSPILVSFGYPKPFNISVILSTITLFILYCISYIFDIFTIYNFAWILVISEFTILLYRLYYCIHLKLLTI